MKKSWAQHEAELDRKYTECLHALALVPREGIAITCPSCTRGSWLALPAQRLPFFSDTLLICCPRACGYFGELATFTPEQQPQQCIGFDTRVTCDRCNVSFATDGVVIRRPCCAIENPREVMTDACSFIRSRLESSRGRAELELALAFLVSHFDGLMRWMLEVGRKNAEYWQTHDPSHPLLASLFALPPSMSFQNLYGVRKRFDTTGWDISNVVPDWPGLTTLFQKRHLLVHRLGVIDEEYVEKTGHTSDDIGKRVPLLEGEILAGCDSCLQIVRSFFGTFLS